MNKLAIRAAAEALYNVEAGEKGWKPLFHTLGLLEQTRWFLRADHALQAAGVVTGISTKARTEFVRELERLRSEVPGDASEDWTDCLFMCLGESGKDDESFGALRQANQERQALWCPEQIPDLSFRGCELAGEVGEVCNVIKKLERERLGWRGSRDTLQHLAEELADVVICADLVALSVGVDLGAAVVEKFNATSAKVGLPTRLGAPQPIESPGRGSKVAGALPNGEDD